MSVFELRVYQWRAAQTSKQKTFFSRALPLTMLYRTVVIDTDRKAPRENFPSTTHATSTSHSHAPNNSRLGVNGHIAFNYKQVSDMYYYVLIAVAFFSIPVFYMTLSIFIYILYTYCLHREHWRSGSCQSLAVSTPWVCQTIYRRKGHGGKINRCLSNASLYY